MSIMLSNRILTGSNVYGEYMFVQWPDKYVDRRTVNLSKVRLQ